LCFLVVGVLHGTSLGADPGRKSRAVPVLKAPLTVKADRLEFRRREHRTVYSGHVLASEKEYRLYCRRLEVHWDPRSKRITHLVAKGDVRLETEEGVVTSQEARLNLSSRTILLTGSPRLVSGDEFVEGDRILYSIDQRRSTVMGKGKRRVRSRLHPGGSEK
jgi:lipopolysaccharide export system protein LptA